MGVFNRFANLFGRIADVKRKHIDSGSHNLFHRCVAEFQRGLKQVALTFVNHAFFLNRINDGGKLLFGHGRTLIFILAPDFGK